MNLYSSTEVWVWEPMGTPFPKDDTGGGSTSGGYSSSLLLSERPGTGVSEGGVSRGYLPRVERPSTVSSLPGTEVGRPWTGRSDRPGTGSKAGGFIPYRPGTGVSTEGRPYTADRSSMQHIPAFPQRLEIPSQDGGEVVGVSCTFSGCYVVQMADGALYGVGRNAYGELGLGHVNYVPTLTRLPLNSDIVRICGGERCFFFLCKDGSGYGCGQSSLFPTTLLSPQPLMPYFMSKGDNIIKSGILQISSTPDAGIALSLQHECICWTHKVAPKKIDFFVGRSVRHVLVAPLSDTSTYPTDAIPTTLCALVDGNVYTWKSTQLTSPAFIPTKINGIPPIVSFASSFCDRAWSVAFLVTENGRLLQYEWQTSSATTISLPPLHDHPVVAVTCTETVALITLRNGTVLSHILGTKKLPEVPQQLVGTVAISMCGRGAKSAGVVVRRQQKTVNVLSFTENSNGCSQLAQDLSAVLENPTLYHPDYKLVCTGGHTFLCHTSILRARCSKGDKFMIPFYVTQPNVVVELLRFIYTDKVVFENILSHHEVLWLCFLGHAIGCPSLVNSTINQYIVMFRASPYEFDAKEHFYQCLEEAHNRDLSDIKSMLLETLVQRPKDISPPPATTPRQILLDIAAASLNAVPREIHTILLHPPLPRTYAQDIQSIRSGSTPPDVEMKVGFANGESTIVWTHAVLLAARSEYFKEAMSGMKCAVKPIMFPYPLVDHSALEVLLSSIYSDTISQTAMTAREAVQLFDAEVNLRLTSSSLHQRCCQVISRDLTCHNAYQLFELAQAVKGSEALKKRLIGFMGKNLVALSELGLLDKMPKNTLLDVVHVFSQNIEMN